MPRPDRPADTGIEAVATILRGMLETARQDGYDAGYADGLAVSTLDSPAEQLRQQSSVGHAGQRVA